MQCPNCGTEMAEKTERVPVLHFPGVKERTLQTKTRLARVHNCPKCRKRFCVCLTLREVP